MANTKQPYYISVGTGVAYRFSGTKTIYTEAIQTLTGINNTVPENAKVFTGAATNFGVVRIRVKYVKSGSGDTAVYGVGTLLCAPSKIEDALSGLAGTTYKGKDITEAYLARRRLYV